MLHADCAGPQGQDWQGMQTEIVSVVHKCGFHFVSRMHNNYERRSLAG